MSPVCVACLKVLVDQLLVDNALQVFGRLINVVSLLQDRTKICDLLKLHQLLHGVVFVGVHVDLSTQSVVNEFDILFV